MNQSSAWFLVSRDIMWTTIYVIMPCIWAANICKDDKIDSGFNLILYFIASGWLAFYLGAHSL